MEFQIQGKNMDFKVFKNPYSYMFLLLNKGFISTLFYICSNNESAPVMAEITMIQGLSNTSHGKECLDVLQICPVLQIINKIWLKNVLGKDVISISEIKLLFTKLQFFIYRTKQSCWIKINFWLSFKLNY